MKFLFFSGAPAAWEPPANIEKHRPLIFLNLNSDNIDTAGLDATLSEENKTNMFELSLIQNASDQVNKKIIKKNYSEYNFLFLDLCYCTMESINS